MPEPEPEDLGFEVQDSGYGHIYLKWCRAVNNRFPSSPEKLEKIENKRKERFKKVEERYDKALLKFREIEQNYDDTNKIYRSSAAKLKKAEKALARAERIYKQEKFNKAITLLGIDVTLQETMTFSGFCALITFFLGFFIFLFVLLIFNTGIIEVAMYLVPGILFAPLLVFGFTASYPEILANRVKTKSLGRSPEAVNYIVMSMRLSPSLSKAIAFAGDSADEPIASGLKKVLWNIYMREYDSVEDSFLAFAYEWT